MPVPLPPMTTRRARVVLLFRNSRPPEVGPETMVRVLAALPRLASEAMPRKPLLSWTWPVNVLTAVRLNPLVLPETPEKTSKRLAVRPLDFGPALWSVGGLIFAVTGYTMWISSLGRFRWRVLGIAVHGLFEQPDLVRGLLGETPQEPLDDVFDTLADAVEEHLDLSAVLA